jgi:AcrR family transcriptional regulator
VSAQPKRPYVSGLREAQARATRRAIVSAAAALFAERGYAATTIDAVAESAGVSRKTVFDSVGGKAALLKLAYDWSLAGDDEPVPMGDRPAIRQIATTSNPEEALRLWVALGADIASRLAPISHVLEVAADVDAEARELQEHAEAERLFGAQSIVRHLDAIGGLAPRYSRRAAVDLCWLYTDPMLYQRLVVRRGWSARRYEALLLETLRSALLDRDQDARVARRRDGGSPDPGAARVDVGDARPPGITAV